MHTTSTRGSGLLTCVYTSDTSRHVLRSSESFPFALDWNPKLALVRRITDALYSTSRPNHSTVRYALKLERIWAASTYRDTDAESTPPLHESIAEGSATSLDDIRTPPTDSSPHQNWDTEGSYSTLDPHKVLTSLTPLERPVDDTSEKMYGWGDLDSGELLQTSWPKW